MREEDDCYPSSCACDADTGRWICTRDCVGHCVDAPVERDCDARCREVAQADIEDCLAGIGPNDDPEICREVGQIGYDTCMQDCR